MEITNTGASCPWNKSTLTTLACAPRAADKIRRLQMYVFLLATGVFISK